MTSKRKLICELGQEADCLESNITAAALHAIYIGHAAASFSKKKQKVPCKSLYRISMNRCIAPEIQASQKFKTDMEGRESVPLFVGK